MPLDQYLASLWKGGFTHRYAITHHRAWNPWKARHEKAKEWWCESLGEAAAHYSWPERDAPNSFDCIAERLRSELFALGDKSDDALAEACLAVFKWGGVARTAKDPSRQWLATRNGLHASIQDAVKRLHPNAVDSLKRFDGKDLLMNSAMTKVYAAADPEQIIIYDGRVGAALGLLVRHWLTSRKQVQVPAELAFRWGPHATCGFRSTVTGRFG